MMPRIGWVLVGLLTIGVWAFGQIPKLPETYALRDVRVVVGDGRRLKRATVLIREGIIVAVGEKVKVPPEAEVIRGEGWTVYPGFIDGGTTKGLKVPGWKPTQDESPDYTAEAPPFMREANRKGIRPQLDAFDHLALTEKLLSAYRQGGFTTALFFPSGGCLNGTSVLVNLSGRPKRESVVVPRVAMHFAFKVPRRVRGYPFSLLGVFAHLRQTLLDAHYYRLLQMAYEMGKGRRPPADETLLALQPVLDGEMPPIFHADTKREILRVIRFAEELRLRPIILGGREAWKVRETLAQKKIPVIVRLDFGKEPKPSGKEGEIPKAVWEERRRKWRERVGNAAKLHQAGVLFAFTTEGTKDLKEFWENLRLTIKEGLSEEAAVAALTLNAAKIFRVARWMGTVGVGKTANLTVMTGPLSDPKAKVRFVFVDGKKFEIKDIPPKKRPEEKP